MCLRALCTLKNDVVLVGYEIDVLPSDQMAPPRTPAVDISPSLSSGSFVHAHSVPCGLSQLHLPSSPYTHIQKIPLETLSSPWPDSGVFWLQKGNWAL